MTPINVPTGSPMSSLTRLTQDYIKSGGLIGFNDSEPYDPWKDNTARILNARVRRLTFDEKSIRTSLMWKNDDVDSISSNHNDVDEENEEENENTENKNSVHNK